MAVLCMCQMGEFLCSGSANKSIGIWKREAYGKLSKVGVIMAMKVQSNACKHHRVILVVGSCSIVEALIVFCPLIFF